MASQLERFREEIEGCVRCGLCTSVCPLYRVLRREPAVARGRLALAQEVLAGRELSWAGMARAADLCLTCNLCGQNCPTGVRGGLLTLALRAEVNRHGPRWGLKGFLYRLVVPRRRILGWLLKALWGLQRFLPSRSTPLRHLPLALEALLLGPRIPKPAPRPLRSLHPGVVPAQGEVRMRVSLFGGCALEFLFPHIGLEASRLLSRLGVEVHYPRGQVCCGMPLMGRGDLEGARRLARRNAEALLASSPDYCVTLCASCGSAIKELYPHLLGEGEDLARRTKDFSELLVDVLGFPQGDAPTTLPPGTKVTYHDPCHLLRYQGIGRQPREVLRSLSGIQLVEHDPQALCCGLGGSFSLEHPRLSDLIGQRKIQLIEDSGAEVVVTSCPGCMIQLMSQASRKGVPLKVLHLAEVLARLTPRTEVQ